MNLLRPLLSTVFIFTTFLAFGQTEKLIGTTDDFIIENISGYATVEERGIEHEEFNVLVFEDQERELSFYFTFYKGAKVCNYIKLSAPLPAIKSEIDYIKSNFTNTSANIWVNASKTVQIQINEKEGRGLILTKPL